MYQNTWQLLLAFTLVLGFWCHWGLFLRPKWAQAVSPMPLHSRPSRLFSTVVFSVDSVPASPPLPVSDPSPVSFFSVVQDPQAPLVSPALCCPFPVSLSSVLSLLYPLLPVYVPGNLFPSVIKWESLFSVPGNDGTSLNFFLIFFLKFSKISLGILEIS